MKIQGLVILVILVLLTSECINFEPEKIFAVETNQVSEISITSWSVSGNIIDLGQTGINQHGFCFSTIPNPTVESNEGIDRLGATNITEEFTTTMSDLEFETTYYVKAYITNSDSSTYGKQIPFTTGIEPGDKPTVTTASATSIQETSATVGGVVTDEGGSSVTERGIYYGASSDPQTTGTKVTIGDGPGTFSTTISVLTENTEYFFVAYATNSIETNFGATLSFTTGQSKVEPSVSTASATSILDTSAIVGGTVTDEGSSRVTERGIYYGTSGDPESSGTKVAIGDGPVAIRDSPGTFSTTISLLTENTEYYFVAYAINSAGPGYGTTLSFTTDQNIVIPTVSTAAATSILETTATAGGEVTNAGGGIVTECGIYYGTSSDPLNSGTKLAIGSGLGSFSTSLTGLTDDTRYYFVAYATNSIGTNFGATMGFTTGQPIVKPSVESIDASLVSETTATVGGDVTGKGGAPVTERGIYYGTSSDPITTGKMVPIGSDTGPFSIILTGLIDGTKYYFVAYAINSAGPGYGSILNFTTDKTIIEPTVSTTAASSVLETATSIQETSATVGGVVTDEGGSSVTERGIYYGTSSDLLNSGKKLAIGSGLGSFSTSLTGLSPGTMYYFVAYATNSVGTSYGTTLRFTAGQTIVKPTVTTTSANTVTETTATIGGEVTNTGRGTVTERGIYYGTSSDPLSTGTKVTIGSGLGSFSTSLTGLIDDTRYYFVAYAINSAGPQGQRI